ncbi:tyrosine-type recombinase/integrase [Stieleria sedimenti]|uniref:tyrosine-type recombinase/integrase n=1 Tax=Stieleria sedimenti TaxID=2976331 RepID=UPI00389A6875
MKLCGHYFEHLITDRWEGRTARNYRQGAKSFTDHFGYDRPLSSITKADFAAWHRWMSKTKGLAEATANKRAKMVRTLLKEAVHAQIIAENPGTGHKIGGEVNPDRQFYVTAEATKSILSQCDSEWALIIGLCRYAGLRCPSEIQALTWSDVQWDENRLRIDSPKTGLRFCPIFEPLRPLFNAAWDRTGDEPAIHVVSRYRDRETNLRTQCHRIIEAAGLVPWQKCFVNLRASCRTDLEEQFPAHVVNGWLGQSSRIAERHYLQTTDAHWERAASNNPFGGVTGGVTSVAQPPPEPTTEDDEDEKTPVLAGSGETGPDTRHAQEDSNLRPSD